ncbi:MAG: hypothetical protein U1C70_01650 [Sediminibacterium sp.]|jgi:hypothetical protein|nr:hypothetical protein [Sediminibacterium sp.]MDZ4070502.1 hypothetical protein [Sediminibacterium sp.]
MIQLRVVLLITAFFSAFMAQSQVNEQDSLAHQRIKLVQNNMYVLGAWASANIIQGTISASNTQGSEKAFHQMNAYWNTVNFAIAGVGLLGIRKQMKRAYGLASNLKEQQKLEKILLLNSGLDLAYIASGLYLKEKGIRLNNTRNEGFGNSLLLQGAFLLVFDLIQYGQHRKNTKWLENKMDHLQMGVSANGLGLSYRF